MPSMRPNPVSGIELLAPARDAKCGMAAIAAGADAVYIGAPRFGARARAGNALRDISALTAYAHTYWARVYVTVNTLLYDDELPVAVELIEALYGIGVDAVIIQDIGLLEVDLPPIPLIASTQMHNHTPERAQFLERIGFRRAILARELTLTEIREIREATESIELEAFVHGALCVSYSGQCYMSYAIGGRSGNRGECAQPCRRKYDLVDRDGRVLVKDRYLLSLRDMNRIADLGAMLDAGITSFKIEGRLKDESYVTNVVSAYRQALDTALGVRQLQRSSSGQSRAHFTPNLHKTYNRGYTPYFLHGRQASPGAIDTPKMIGEFLGTVKAIDRNSFTLKTGTQLHNGDGLAFFDTTHTLCGTVVNGTRNTKWGLVVTPNSLEGLHVGTRVFRNRDHAFLGEVTREPVTRTLGVVFTVRESADDLQVSAEDEDGNAATVHYDAALEHAHRPEQATATVRKQLSKTGGTPFHCEGVIIEWATPLFLPFSELNELRRQVLEELLVIREKNRPQLREVRIEDDVPYPVDTLSFRANALNAKAHAFYRRRGVTELEPAAESGLEMKGRVVMTTRYCLKEELGWCPQQPTAGKERSPHDEPYYLVDGDGHRYRLKFRCSQAPDECGMDIIY